jgi:sec-independent protein translocase protein TatA
VAFDDPVVWILLVAVVVFLFGANKIPELARSIGEARREFNLASKTLTSPISALTDPLTLAKPAQTNEGAANSGLVPALEKDSAPVSEDPVIAAAKSEGITTEGKTRKQIAEELASKLNQNETSSNPV